MTDEARRHSNQSVAMVSCWTAVTDTSISVSPCRSTPTQALCGQCCGSSPIHSCQILSMTDLSVMLARYTCAETIRVFSDPNSCRFFSRTASVSLVCPSMSSVLSLAVATVHTRSLYADAAFRPIYFPLKRVIIMFLKAIDLSYWIIWAQITLKLLVEILIFYLRHQAPYRSVSASPQSSVCFVSSSA